MRESPLYSDPGLVARTTQYLVDKGDTVFQIHRLAPTQEEHVAALLEFFNPPYGATILDAGCGVGAVSEGMKALRPDLSFILLNNSTEQLKFCPAGFETLRADMESVPLPDASLDAVMVCYALGHVDLLAALTEFARITRPGGMLYIYDLTSENTKVLEKEMFYTASSIQQIGWTAQAMDYREVSVKAPPTYADHFYDKMDKATCDRVLACVVPVLFSFVKAS